jgi:hypothetical protein
MPTPNPDYDPKAVEFQRVHAERLNRLNTLRAAQYSAQGLTPTQIAEKATLEAKTASDRNAFEETFYTMHPTIQDYARWRMSLYFAREGFPVNPEDLDVEQLTTRTAVGRVCTILEETADNFANYQSRRKPLGQPNGIDAFSKDHQVDKLNVTFNLHSVIGVHPTVAPVALDQYDGRAHICLTHVSQEGVSVINGIEQIATAMLTTQKGLDRQDGQPGTLAKDFQFYVYIPPQVTDESFMRVDMKFVDGQYVRPDFVHFDKVPAKIREIADDLMQGELTVLKSLRCLDAP